MQPRKPGAAGDGANKLGKRCVGVCHATPVVRGPVDQNLPQDSDPVVAGTATVALHRRIICL
jgi:hypothetical protein